ncbi:L-seryl-tRNA(Sec) kinase isoform 1-T1 [Spinachia spinachia]
MAAHEGAAGVGRSAACLCVLCGLPAAGKSSLALRVLRAAPQRGWRACALPYDDLIPGHAFHTRGAQGAGGIPNNHTEWRLHRQAVLRCIGQFLENPQLSAQLPADCPLNKAAWERCVEAPLRCDAVHRSPAGQAPLVLLLDDNFYYPSMRYEVYQLARKYSLGFCQVYLQCDVESCISRNQTRSEPIPTDVIVEMVNRLESPNPQKYSWETNSISINTTGDLSTCDIQRVMELISCSLSNPPSPAVDNTEQREADRLKCATSVVHQTDQACRRHISEAMKTARENHVAPEQMRSLAAQLSASKATFLHSLRRQLLHEAPFAQEEDIDVDRVAKRAVDVFYHEKKEILLRVIGENQ